MQLTKVKIHKSLFYRLAFFKCFIWLFVFIILMLHSVIIDVHAAETPGAAVFMSRTYILGEGETVDSVARKYHITAENLKNLNKFRTFSKPFASLTAGDEIDVPAGDTLSKPGLPIAVATDDDQRFINRFTTLGTMMSADQSDGEMGARVGSLVTGEAGAAMQKWLNHYGTARVKINTDNRFRFVNSSLDFLLPLYDDDSAMLFVQLGGRNNDDRNTLNMGWGIRTYHDAWLYGMNFFYDNDLTGNNRRAGVGAEAWTDYLKLSANNYFALSGWHQSRDYADYNERPADGYDVRAQAWLPAWPQLGGKLIYEKYRGDDVALFGRGTRVQNPYAVTLGVNYTPFPLLTLGANYRIGKGNNEDTSINLQLNYRIGETWQKQIDPADVAVMRTLAVSRYDLVERNNDIVLEYQKQELIRLILPEQLTGTAGETMHISAQVMAKYGLARIDWDAAELVGAGGAVTLPATDAIDIVLPPFRQGGASANRYHLRARAIDQQGNGSNQAQVVINIVAPAEQLVISGLAVTVDNAEANGAAANEVQATVTLAGRAVAGQAVNFSATNEATVPSPVVTDRFGIATARITSLKGGTSQVRATVAGSSRAVDVHFAAVAAPDEANTTLEILTSGDKVADNIDAHQIKLTVRDINNQPLADLPVTFSADNDARVNPASGRTRDDGTLMASVTTDRPGPVKVTAAVEGISKTSGEMHFIEQVVMLSIAVTANDGLSNGLQQNVAEIIAKDVNGIPLPNVQLALSATYTLPSNPGTLTIDSSTNPVTDGNGRAEVRYTSTSNGSVVLTAALGNGQNYSSTGGRFASPTATWRVITNNQPADGFSRNRIEIDLLSPRGEPVPNARIDITFVRVQSGVQLPSTAAAVVNPVFTGADGIATLEATNGSAEANVVVLGALAAYNLGMQINSTGNYMNFL
ncbi:inverse autotransporter beta domain-containing protein [Sodalis sp. RH20]|uniref:inverse autotransporter beta domain-containing protein n=1 Tax=unclassified Sodalis (in: enterobacteria) TaxID=2636512 RepID=UPI0039B5D5BA